MATRRDTARAQDDSDPATVSHTKLLPALREYHTSDLQPSTQQAQAQAQALLSLLHDLGEIENRQTPAGLQ